MQDIALSGLTRHFGAVPAVDGVTLSVPGGAFFALVGPSGCGKTTLLRLIAGLEAPDGGTIRLAGRLVAGGPRFIPAEERGLGMVFQSYALWPHMTVGQNVAFGLALRSMPRAARAARVAEALALVGLADMEDRLPHRLSGGQRQRVALARSLALRPGLILLDEPLANLDAHLRQTMLSEFRRIHREAGTTFVFVTHDQNEAMALADRVAVMDRGRIEQVAPPQDLFARPATPMVARFVGGGRTVPVDVLGRTPAGCTLRLQDRLLEVPGAAATGPGWLCLRARDLTPAPARDAQRLSARVVDQRFEAGDYVLSLALDRVEGVTLETTSPTPATLGATLDVGLRGGWVLPRAA
ncbi:ABC transporter ATP-binding protein [Halovulum dunhuangense]|uniref:ABC transporter ATP-binding protein n=1 Tax=Halovulum dunhuangense TaxID=1505036 RepID=A0A849L6T1_9RHOB|nr:ABC transporter ATP-binding protein [Halovulum dunhuangense]NNU81820.1 ABC transporter ATP-binding protein [Halovulum dunhuangense]